jgi:hypothetical protein
VRLQARSSQWVIRVLVVALAVAAAPLPSFAGDPNAPVKPRPTLTMLVKQAAAVTPVTVARAQGTSNKADKSSLDSPSFFKSKAGVIALVVLGAGAAFTIYSSQNDRIHSVARQ